jgi:hypothetical protein
MYDESRSNGRRCTRAGVGFTGKALGRRFGGHWAGGAGGSPPVAVAAVTVTRAQPSALSRVLLEIAVMAQWPRRDYAVAMT